MNENAVSWYFSIFLLCCAYFGYQYYSENSTTVQKPPSFSVEAKQLFNDYAENELNADTKYKGKTITINNATVRSISETWGEIEVMLKSERVLEYAMASFSSKHKSFLTNVKTDDSINMICQVDGQGVNIYLSNCRPPSESSSDTKPKKNAVSNLDEHAIKIVQFFYDMLAQDTGIEFSARENIVLINQIYRLQNDYIYLVKINSREASYTKSEDSFEIFVPCFTMKNGKPAYKISDSYDPIGKFSPEQAQKAIYNRIDDCKKFFNSPTKNPPKKLVTNSHVKENSNLEIDVRNINEDIFQGQWNLKVGSDSSNYYIQAKQNGNNISGVLLNQSNNKSFHLKQGQISKLNTEEWHFSFKEGESIWSGKIIKEQNLYLIKNGKVHHAATGKFQASFYGDIDSEHQLDKVRQEIQSQIDTPISLE